MTDLGRYLRARRDLRTPEAAGLPADPGRRVPGLRRDEVAGLAGISADYYLKLEQGRVPAPSEQVLRALARALGVDGVALEHMRRLASGGGTVAPPPAEVGPTLQRVLDQWPHTPAYVVDRHLDVLAANAAMVELSDGRLDAGANVLLLLFSPATRRRLPGWAQVARTAVGSFRFEADLSSPRCQEILATLAPDPDFARCWDRHEVARPSAFVLAAHLDGRGVVRIGVQHLLVPDAPGVRVTVYHAGPQGAVAREADELRHQSKS